MRGKWSKTIYMRMLLTYLPLVAAIMIGSTSIIVLIAGRYFAREMDKMRKTTLYTVADVFDEKISSLYDALFQLAMNGTLLEYYKTDEANLAYDDIMIIQSVKEAIANTVFNNALVLDAFLYRFDSNTVFSSQYRGQGSYDPVNSQWTFFGDYFVDMTRDDVCAALEVMERRQFLNLGNEDKSTLLLAAPIPIASGRSNMVLALIVNTEMLKRLSELSLGEREDLLIIDAADRILFSLNGAHAGKLVTETEFAPDDGSAAGYSIYSKESVHAKLAYLYVTDPTFLQHHANMLVLYGALVGSGALLVISVLILLLSRRIYRPIESILKMFTGSLPSNASDRDTDIIRAGISGLRLEDAQLRRHIQSTRPYVTEQILYKMLRDDIPAAKARQVMKDMSIRFDRGYAAVIILRISGYAAMTRNLSESIVTSVKEQLASDIVALTSDAVDLYVVSDHNTLYAIASHDLDADAFEKMISDRLESAQQQVLVKYYIRLRIVVGATLPVAESGNTDALMDSMQESLATAEETMEQMFFTGSEQILCLASEHVLKSINAYCFSKEEEQELSGLLFMGQKEQAIVRVQDIIENNKQISRCNYGNMKQLLSDLLSVAIKILLNSNTPLDRVLMPRHKLFAGCEDCESLDQAVSYICDVYEKVAVFFLSTDGRWPVRREDVLAYIRQTLDRDSSIADIARHFNLSKGYFCRIFREMTGVTTLEYISRCRIERAHELIVEGRYSLKSIAGRVGISNYKTFIRLFKKYTLCTPGQYKEKMLRS